ncbi:putative ABC transport system permease protein [Nocardiopsis arvandica]|uniref:Putative ABC transport system permease protein n=1 Tax=Nocardiopsis sinuspersici TaxID=501010 RepID=A0A7Z0BJU3_9ACTN|nr:ABC transporter permease [Nocardiopsis sinuspersici]NYH51754.1 putative ABC transport system permease protein [Nocardiopsis sinuspersici]
MLRSLTAGIVLAFAGSRANVARTILSCAGIVVGVGALIMVVTASDFGQRFATAYSEANAGRPATLQVSVFGQITDRAAFEEDLVRAGGQDVSVYHTPSGAPKIRSGGSVVPDVQFLGVDPSLGDIRRMNMAEGRWLTEADTGSLAPVMVVNQPLADALGDLTQVQVGTDQWLDVRVVGVLESSALDLGWYSVYLLRSPASEDLLFGSSSDTGGEEGDPFAMPGSQTTYQVRIDPQDPAAQDPWGEIFTGRLASASWRWGIEDPESISAYRADYAEEVDRIIDYMSWGLMGIAVITLATGLLGVLNVGLVTVRERRRELATYRALGASRSTLFVAVVMEAVVVSLVAGVIALAGCWAAVVAGGMVLERFVPLPDGVPLNIPASGVLVGLGSAALVGLLAGIIPATRALRASVVAGLRE